MQNKQVWHKERKISDISNITTATTTTTITITTPTTNSHSQSTFVFDTPMLYLDIFFIRLPVHSRQEDEDKGSLEGPQRDGDNEKRKEGGKILHKRKRKSGKERGRSEGIERVRM